jgi:isoquinoline 1-oxidoreductase beta subunit
MGRLIPAMAGSDPAPSAAAIEGAAHIPYAFPDISVEHALVNLPVPLGFWRSVGHSFTGFIVESFVDELAYAAKQSPYDFRLALLRDEPRYAAVLKAAARLGGLPGPVEAPAGARAGRGIAIHKSFGSIVAEVAEVEVKPGALRVSRVAAAIDCGPVVNPAIVASQVESGILFGLTAALYGKVGFEEGRSTVTNFDGYPLLGLAESPAIDVVIVNSGGPIGGVGEPGTPPIAPAVANAIYAATGKRLRDLPLAAQV